jgi:hypothetical protein
VPGGNRRGLPDLPPVPSLPPVPVPTPTLPPLPPPPGGGGGGGGGSICLPGTVCIGSPARGTAYDMNLAALMMGGYS